MKSRKSYDPRMHSAEHILNQTMDRMLGCGRCFSAHIEKKKSKCDYRFGRTLTGEETAEIEGRVNAVIQADLPVTERFLSRVEAERLFRLDRLPEEAGESIRIVSIGDYDACPCVGPHVASTGQIGAFRLLSASHQEGVLRLRFKLEPTGGPGLSSTGPGVDPVS
jgi:alanyl-tRNA synthetase